MIRVTLVAALVAVAACGDRGSDDAGPESTEISRAEADQQRTAQQADLDVRTAQAEAARQISPTATSKGQTAQ